MFFSKMDKEFTPAFFDESSRTWMMNKKRKGYSYVYVCKKEKCKNKCFGSTDLCKWHNPHVQPIRRSPRFKPLLSNNHSSKPSNSQENEVQVVSQPHQHIGGSPTVLQDQDVSYTDEHTQQVSPFQ
jgi:hypothetical protein